MKFNFKEWQSIRHDLEVAKNEYIRQMESSTPKEDPLSFYQIFKRQVEQTQEFIDRIDNALL